jgi:hypothetical protein
MSRKVILSAVVLLLGMAQPGDAVADGIPIAPEQVAGVLRAAGMNVTPQQISLPAAVVATSRNPVLKVGGIEAWRDHQIRVRVECTHPAECLPFVIAVLDSHDQQVIPTSAGALNAFEMTAASHPAAAPLIVRAGSPANLLLVGEHIRIQLPVICLQSGRLGQTIRVTSKDRRQTFSAEVARPSALKGRLQ